jgi:hypothetical protein
MTTHRNQRGRPPSLWHAKAGKAFLRAVFQIQSERHPIKTVDAINIVVKRPEFAYLKGRYPLRYLEKKYQELSALNPFSQLHKKYRRLEYLRAIQGQK